MTPSPVFASVPQNPVPAPPPAPGGLAFWQTELANLNAQLAGLRVEADQLQRQLPQANGFPAASIEARAAEVSLQIARTEGDIAQVQARIAGKQGTTTTGTVPRPYGPMRGVDPRMAVGMAFVLTLVLLVPLVTALARRIARGGARPGSSDVAEIAPRLDRLEHAVDSIAIEVERISEGQRFVTKILAEQPQAKGSIPGSSR